MYIISLTLNIFIITNHISNVKHLSIPIFPFKETESRLTSFLEENQHFYALYSTIMKQAIVTKTVL